jgi:hypothetical protein
MCMAEAGKAQKDISMFVAVQSSCGATVALSTTRCAKHRSCPLRIIQYASIALEAYAGQSQCMVYTYHVLYEPRGRKHTSLRCICTHPT